MDKRVQYLNPPDETNLNPLPINFYLSNESYLSKIRTGGADYFIEVDLFYNGTLIMNKPVFAFAHGYLESQEALATVQEVYIGFKLSHAYPFQVYAKNLTTIDVELKLHRYNESELRDGKGIMIYWATPGDFPLVTATFFYNKSEPWVQTTDVPVVHVEPESEAVAERINRVNLGLTVALTYFAFVEGISKIMDFLGKKKDNSIQPNANKHESRPRKQNTEHKNV